MIQYRSLIFICFVLFLGIYTSGSVSAAIITCPGKPASTMNWSSSGCPALPVINSANFVCKHDPTVYSGNKSIANDGTSCTATISCGPSSASDTLTYRPDLIWNTSTVSCVAPLSISTPAGSTITLPTTAFSASYTLTNGTGTNSDCYLLNSAGTVVSTSLACTSPFSYNTPTTPGAYGYYVRAFKASTNETVTSSMFTVTVNPVPVDLTAGSVSPISAVATIPVTLSANITNSGGLSTGASFDNFMQVATAANGGGTVTDLASANMSTLTSGASAATSRSYTFPSAGTYSVRACADKSNSLNAGTIAESNEGNNCGVWTTTSVSAAPLPDLTAGSVSPVSALAVTPVTLSSNITNSGNFSTGASFDNFIQVATAANGAGTITDLAAVNMSTLASGASAVTSRSYTFASYGTYSARACTDKSNRDSLGTIRESNEGNNCGGWMNITVAANPIITNPLLIFPTISFTCQNSDSYSVTHNETGQITASGATASNVTANITAPVTYGMEGNYTLRCIAGAATASAIVNYTIPTMTFDGMFITAGPRTVNKNKSTTISWSILNPKNTCSLSAKVVCSGGSASCTQAQSNEETSLNSTLTTGTTDANDQYGASRNIQTAVKTAAPENNPTLNKALGKKTLSVNYTTDFILDCGGTFIKKIRVIVSDENEG